jgi:Zn-dependent protease
MPGTMDGRFEIRFRVGPLPVAIEPTFWLGAIVLGSFGGIGPQLLVWVAIVLVSILVHELGHALTALAFGVRSRIQLHMWGGLTLPERALPRWRDLLMSLAGPGAGFVLGGLCWLAGRAFLSEASHPLWQVASDYAEFVNFGWGLFNLLPILPLDGGHVLLGVLGPKRQRSALAVGGVVAGLAAIALGALQWGAYPVILFGLFAFRNLQAFFASRALPRGPAEAITLDQALARGWTALSGGTEDDADRLGRLVLEHAPDAQSRNRARDLLAWAALASADPRGALRHLERSEPPESARALTSAMVLDALDDRVHALPYALRAVEVEPSETSANLAVRLLAATGDFERAIALAGSFAWPRPAARSTALGDATFAQGAFAAAAEHYASAFETTRQGGDAYSAACSFARAGDRVQAHAWLRRAVTSGFDDLDHLLSDPDLSSIKDDPELRALVEERRTS